MARSVSTDPFSLAGTELAITASTVNPSIQTAEANDERGDTVARETYEHISAPSATYSVKADFDCATVSLGTLIDGGSNQDTVVLGYNITTAAGSPPTVEVSGETVPTASTQGHTYTTPAMTLEPDHKAQILFAAFTLAGTGCHLTSCNASLSCSISRALDDDAETCYWDVSKGQVEVTAEIVKTAATVPTVTAASNWTITKPLTGLGVTVGDETNSDYEKYSVTLRFTPTAVAPV